MSTYRNGEHPNRQPDLAATLEALKTVDDGTPSATIFYGLSGLSVEALEQIKPIWESLMPSSRGKIMRQMVEISEADFELDYRTIGLFGLEDSHSEVRKAAIDMLWEDESLLLMDRLIEMAQWDEAGDVRAAATGALGRFILLGELGSLSEDDTMRAQDVVVDLWNNPDEDLEVRRRALEAIANCSHEIVIEAIQEAYQSHERLMRISAIFAMGRTYDERWNEIVLRETENSDPEIRYEAARACGELEILEAVPQLARLAQDTDREIAEVAIWSLGEIGGKEALRVLRRLADEASEADDDALLQSVEDAIGNASLAGGDIPFAFDFDDERDD